MRNKDENLLRQLSILLPYLVLPLSIDTRDSTKNKIEKIKDELFDILILKELTENNFSILDFLLQADLLNYHQLDEFFEKTLHLARINLPLGYKMMISLIPWLGTTQVQEIYSYLLKQFESLDSEDEYREAYTVLMAILPKLEFDQVKEALQGIVKKVLCCGPSIEEVCEIILSALKREYIQLIFPLIVKGLFPENENSQHACYMLNALAPRLDYEEIERVYRILMQLILIEQDESTCLAAFETLQAFVVRLEPQEIRTVFYFLITLLEQCHEMEEDYRLGAANDLLSVMILRLQPEEIGLLIKRLSFLLQDPGKHSHAVKLSIISLPHLPINEINRIIPLILNGMRKEEKKFLIYYYETLDAFAAYLEEEEKKEIAAAVIEMLSLEAEYIPCLLNDKLLLKFLPYLRPELIPKLLGKLQLFLQGDNDYISAAAGKILVSLLPYLKPEQINIVLELTLKLLHKGKASVTFQSDVALIDMLWAKLTLGQRSEFFNAIQKLIQAKTDPSVYLSKGIYNILIHQLPNLSQDELISILPDVEVVAFQGSNVPQGVAIANLLCEVNTRIDFTTIPPEKILAKPILIVLKLMQEYSQKIYTSKPIKKGANCEDYPLVTHPGQRFFQQHPQAPNQVIPSNQNRIPKRPHSEYDKLDNNFSDKKPSFR